MENILSVKGIKKSFGGVHALKGVDLTIKKGETHCLAGENGCGKSTIIKVISGFYKPDAGSIEVNGIVHPHMTPSDAIKAGIQVIYQDFSLFPNLSVLENLAFNQVLANNEKFVNKKRFRTIAEEAIQKINFNVDLDARVEQLPVADKQLIAISRALVHDAKFIIMDEPTTALTSKEVNRLFDIIAELKSKGITILFVSHKLDEVFEISDSITVLRSGENVISCPASEMTEDKFTYYMTGRHFENESSTLPKEISKEIILEAQNLSAKGFEDVSFKLHKGEILGVTGQLGSGRTELSLSLFGLNRPVSGKIIMEGQEVSLNSVQEAQKLKIALVPEDRLTEGLFIPQSITDNITVTRLNSLSSMGVLNKGRLMNEASTWVEKLEIATQNPTNAAGTLSGGNQQKVVLAKWLSDNPKILILNGPTVGVDIGAKYDIHKLLKQLAMQGMSIIVVSDDTAEVVSLCDRAIVMQGGKMTGALEKEDLNTVNLNKATV
ncbi:sugar ABC transporter ATP-binding protein [uncultured Oribacterium sp.]|uniref:sugar ABC transporter ATP-binding protein n=1 Tax=uncultured Oribacterium sp. TaxID=462198 RepID=UPI002804C237|nr:sugar ABC transporter ATP-binding protein [uncultured Oribacterium sp.]